MLGIITVNYNSSRDTVDLLRSIGKERSGRRAIICVVDNNSRPEQREELEGFLFRDMTLREGVSVFREALTVENRFGSAVMPSLRQAFDDFRGSDARFLVLYIALEENIGFSAANNLAYRVIRRPVDYLVIINNDMVVAEDFFEPLLKPFRDDPLCVCSTGRIFFHEPGDVTWYAGGRFTFEPKLRNRHPGRGRREDPGSSTGRPHKRVTFVSGALMVLSEDFVEEHGLFYEGYFYGEEDAEICDRIRRLGLRMYYAPESVSWHKVGMSRKVLTPDIFKMIMKSKYLMPAMTSPFYIFYPWLVSFSAYKLVSMATTRAASRLNTGYLDLARSQAASLAYCLRVRLSRGYRVSQFYHRSRRILGSDS